MADLKLRAKSEGLDRIEREFDGLTKAQQRNLLKTSAVGKEFANMERRAVGAIKRTEAATNGSDKTIGKLGDSLKGLIGGFTAVGAAGGLAFKGVSAIIKQTEERAENLRRILRESTDASALKGSSSGSILLNAGDLAKNVPEAKRVIAALDKVAIERGRTGAELGNAFAEIRPATGGATDDERIQALGLGFKAKQLDENFQVPGFTSAIIKINQANVRRGEKSDLNKASDQYFAIGDAAGLNTNELGRPLTTLIGAESTGATIQQLGGALAFSTASTGKSGEAAVETIVPLFAELAANEKFKIAGKSVTLQGQDPVAKLLDFVDRLNKGDFGSNKSRAISDLTGNVGGQLLVGAIAADSKGFKESTTAALTSKGGGIEDRFQAQRELSPTFDEQNRTNQAKAQTFEANAADVRSARIELQAQQVEEFLRQQGEDPTKSGDVSEILRDSVDFTAKNRGDNIRNQLAAGASPAEVRRDLTKQLLNEAAPLSGPRNTVTAQRRAIEDRLNADDERGAARLQIRSGNLNLEDGLQRNEQALLRMAGASETFIRQLQLSKDELEKLTAAQRQQYEQDSKAILGTTAATSATTTAQEVR